jgi:hypothetical protein
VSRSPHLASLLLGLEERVDLAHSKRGHRLAQPLSLGECGLQHGRLILRQRELEVHVRIALTRSLLTNYWQ